MVPLKQNMENPVLTALLSSDILILFFKLSREVRSELLIRCQSKRRIIVLMGRCMFGNYFFFFFFFFFLNKIDQS